jgi:hypothetical protein
MATQITFNVVCELRGLTGGKINRKAKEVSNEKLLLLLRLRG